MVGGSPFPIAVTERAALQIATVLALRWINYPLMQVFTCKDLSLHGKIYSVLSACMFTISVAHIIYWWFREAAFC